jgi:hypothetical protein
MKKIFLTLILLHIVLVSKSQVTNYRWHTYGKFSAGMIDSSGYINGGLSAELMVFKRLCFNYNLEFQHRTDKYNHLHGSIGSVGGPVIFGLGLAAGLANSADGDTSNNNGIGVKGMLLGLLVMVLPDGFSYHMPIGYKWNFSPYANILGFDWIRNREKGYSEFKYSCSFGVRGTYLINDRMTAIGFIETRKAAPTGWGIGAGIGLGYLFKLRENDPQENPN